MKTFVLILALLNPATGQVEPHQIDSYSNRQSCAAAAFEAALGARQNDLIVVGGSCINRFFEEASA